MMVWRYIRAIVVLPPLFCKWCCKINVKVVPTVFCKWCCKIDVKVVPTVFCKWCCKIDVGKWFSLYFCDWRLVEIMMHAFDHIFQKKMNRPGLFFVYFWSFQTNNTMFTTNQCEKMSIQYTAPEFKPTTPITTRPVANLINILWS